MVNDFEDAVIIDEQGNSVAKSLMKDVYWWMALALLVTGATSYFTANTSLIGYIFQSSGILIALCLAELALVMGLSAAISRLSVGTAITMFIAYSVLNGLTMASIFVVYTQESIAGTFFITAGMFAGMALYGTMTKRDLSGLGRFFLMALIGLIIATVVNIFVASSALYWGITFIGVILFAALTAYDTQKIRALMAQQYEQNEVTSKLTILGALTLYLDFINLFLYLLRIFGNRK